MSDCGRTDCRIWDGCTRDKDNCNLYLPPRSDTMTQIAAELVSMGLFPVGLTKEDMVRKRDDLAKPKKAYELLREINSRLRELQSLLEE